MKMNRVLGLALGASLLVATSCMEDESMINNNEIAPEVLAKFDALGFNSNDVVKFYGNDAVAGEREGYMVGGDVFISEEQLNDMQPFSEVPGAEQYRTNNLVGGLPRTISVIGYTGGSNALTTNMRNGLSYAIGNYNALNTGLNFTVSFSTSTSANIVVYKVSGGGGGSAGFPSGGNPYKWVQILSGTDSYGDQVCEHVITHEIGHCMGLRHTDYFNRSYSCGSGGNEGDGGVGAVHIPGTPTSYDSNSIMLSCFSANEDGEFSNYDRIALEYLY